MICTTIFAKICLVVSVHLPAVIYFTRILEATLVVRWKLFKFNKIKNAKIKFLTISTNRIMAMQSKQYKD